MTLPEQPVVLTGSVRFAYQYSKVVIYEYAVFNFLSGDIKNVYVPPTQFEFRGLQFQSPVRGLRGHISQMFFQSHL